MDIVIVNWNSGKQLFKCLSSLYSKVGSTVRTIVVVDNDSCDGSAADVESIDPRIRLIEAGRNLGFGAACNLGASQCGAHLLLFLNPDSVIFPEAIERVREFLDSDEGAGYGICGVRLIDESGHAHRNCSHFPTWKMLLARSTGLDVAFPGLTPPYFIDERDCQFDRDVDHVVGAFFVVRRCVFEELGGFDERFFLYLEDLDFSLRALRNGWKTRYLATVSSFHKGGGTSEAVKGRRLFYSLRSHILYSFKNMPSQHAVMVAAAILFIEPLPRLLRAVLRRSISEAAETIEAYALLWRDALIFPKSLFKK